MKYSTTLLSASVAIAFGISGAAFAVENGDFELPAAATPGDDPASWDLGDDSAAAGINNAIPHGGDQYLALGFAGTPGGDSNASSDADEDLTGCSPYDLAVWDASGWFQTFEDDTAYFDVTFDAGPGSLTSPLTGGDGTVDGWVEVTDTGNIDADAATATVTVGGVEIDGIDGRADAIWDDVEFSADCVDAFSKISGKIGNRRGSHSFSGAFGVLESGAVVGTIFVNYKDENTTCTFTPTHLKTINPTFAVWGAEYSCDNGDIGSVAIAIEGGTGGAEGRGKNKDRGGVNINFAIDTEYCIPKDSCDDLSTTDLDKGNAHIGNPGGL